MNKVEIQSGDLLVATFPEHPPNKFYEDNGCRYVVEVIDLRTAIPSSPSPLLAFLLFRKLTLVNESLPMLTTYDHNERDRLIPNCHHCRFKRRLLGNVHIACKHPSVTHRYEKDLYGMLTPNAGKGGIYPNELDVWGRHTAMAKGWFAWPFNYGPVWLLRCIGYESK